MMEKLLLIEDSRFLKIAMKRGLTEAGFSVVEATDGEEALRLTRDIRPDLIILDAMLPRLAGEHVLRALKEDPTTAGIRVLVVSSLAQSNADKLKDEGAIAYIEKSKLDLATGDNLVRIVKAALRKSIQRASHVSVKN